MQIHKNIQSLPAFTNAVITIGSFDGVHRGHQKILQRIRSLSKEISGESVVITFHPHPRQIIYPKDKSLKLLSTLQERIRLIEMQGIDHLVVVPFSIEFSQQDPREYIEKFLLGKFTPSYIVVGYDHQFGLNRTGDIRLLRSYCESHNFEVLQIEKQEMEDITISSTKVRNALSLAEMSTAYKLLNHHYRISGTVVHGQRIGTQLGFPTANLRLSNKRKLVPPHGIYACYIHYGSKKFDGMLYIGRKPTIDGKHKTSIEVNIFEFNQSIYGETLDIEIVMFLRSDEKFETLEALAIQLKEDKLNAQTILSAFNKAEAKKAFATIAILNYNGKEYLEAFLPTVIDSSIAYNYDVWVADNNSSDDSLAYVKEWHPEVTLLPFKKNYGFARGYNQIFKQLDSKYTVILNSDVMVTPNWLDPILDLMEKDRLIAACQPKILALEKENKFEYAGAAGGLMDKWGYPFCYGRIFQKTEVDEGQYDDVEEVFWASGAAMVVRTDLFKQMGGFDEDYFAHQEEIDLCWRLKQFGYKVMAVPASKVYHLGGGTLNYGNSKKTFLNLETIYGR